ncbi:MAG: hypothetical protein KMY55_08135 [Dethiosulfatibacter sp.]|nr:hypothetical protein [Dethiosulfatibacter sp.]
MKNRIIAMILIVSLILPLAACGGKTAAAPVISEKMLAEAVLNEENLVLGSEGVELRLDPVIVSSDVKAIISEVSNAPALDDEGIISLKVYDFKLENVSQVDGVIQLAIPLKLVEGEIPGAAYLNESTGEWEPVAFMYDKPSSSVIIFTDHLSKYGVFSVTNAGKRHARVEFLDLYGEGTDEDFQAAVEEYAIGGVPATQCFDIGAGAAGDAMQLGGDFLGNVVQSAGYLAYGDDVLSTLGDHLGSIGLMLSVVQIGTNIYRGNINDAVVASLKTSLTYVLGKAASKLSSSVMSASMASIAIVDYAINKFGTTAIEGRADIYRDAYSIYYSKGEDGFKGSDYWYKTFYPMFSDPTMTEESLKTEIDKIVTTHCNEFWTGTNKSGVDYYVSEAREKMAWTGGGAGLNQGLQDSISQERRSVLYNDVLPGVFRQIALKINMDNETKLRAEYKALSDYLNKTIAFSVTDTKKTYAKHLVRFSPLNDKAEIDNWTGKFKDDGTLNTAFTLYGHMVAGSPNKLDIYAPDADMEKDEPVKSIEFKVTPPAVELVISEEAGRLTTLITQRSSGDIVSNFLVEDEYKSYFPEELYPLPLEHMLSQQPISIPKDNIISTSLSGSWDAGTESGKNSRGDEWSTSYRYDVHNFDLNLTLKTNMELPVIGTDKKGLLLDGAGTYSYTVTITTVTTGYQETVALFEKAWSEGSVTRSITFTSTGNVALYTSSRAIDSSKGVVVYPEGIDNLETLGVILEFENPINNISGKATSYTKITWEDETEKEESSTYTIDNLDPNVIMLDASKIYFKYPTN